MDFVKRWWLQTRDAMSQMSVAARLALVSLVVILLFVAGAMMLWVGQPNWVPIEVGDREADVRSRLQTEGISVRTVNSRLSVPISQRDHAMAVLAQHELLAPDISSTFDDIIGRQNLWDSNEKTRQNLLLAKREALAQIIRKMRGVAWADVLVDMPAQEGFGRKVSPSASVSLVMQGTRPVGKQLVEAIAGLVSGAFAEMDTMDVVVVDANHGRSLTVRNDADAAASEAMEYVQRLEKRYRDKVEEALSFIPGVIVAVSVRTDNVQAARVEKVQYDRDQPLADQYIREQTQTTGGAGGEPGARPNIGLSIDTAASPASVNTEMEERTTFRDKPVVERVHQTMVGQQLEQVNVTVNVPRRYFETLFMRGKPEDAPTPDDDELARFSERHLAQIKAMIEPIVSAEQTGVVAAHMVPDPSSFPAGPQIVSAGSGLAAIINSDLTKPVALSALALLSVGLMLALVRKAAAGASLPTAEELAGVPPMLIGEEELLGEVGASDLGLTGVELDEEEVRSRKIAEQISKMVQGNPEEAASLLRKWVHTEG